MSPISNSTEPPIRANHSLLEAFVTQAEWCRKLGSPFTARLCESAIDVLDASTRTGTAILAWPGDPCARADALALRLAGAIHAMKLQGKCAALEEIFPPADVSDETFKNTLRDAVIECDDEVVRWLELPPQTNEVARSAIILAGLLEIARRTGLPCSLFELGASAGLNLMVDKYAYHLGGLDTGTADSELVLSPQWEGPQPPAAHLRVSARYGVDLAPLDVTQAEDRLRLSAYVWADQQLRLARVRSAIKIAKRQPPEIQRGSAEQWLEAQLTETPKEGVCRVVMHTIAFHYFPQAAQERISSLLEEAGAKAGAQTPLAWLRFDLDAESSLGATLRLRLWPGGTDELLAYADSHVNRIKWMKKTL